MKTYVMIGAAILAGILLSACGSAAAKARQAGPATPTSTIESAPLCSASSPSGSYCETQAQLSAHTQFVHMATVPDSVFLAQGDELLAPNGTPAVSRTAASNAAIHKIAQHWPLAKAKEIVLADSVKTGGLSKTGSLQWVVSLTLPSGITLPAVPANVPANHAGVGQLSHTYIIVWVNATTGAVDGVVSIQE